MLTMLPENDEADGLRLRVEGATFSPDQLTRRRYDCLVKTTAVIIVCSPQTTDPAVERSGEILVRRING